MVCRLCLSCKHLPLSLGRELCSFPMKSTLTMIRDDDALEEEPVINVDYLSHVWREEDIWVTRRYVLRKKKTLKHSTRLENALWRAWTKYQQQLKTVSPDSVSWLVNTEWCRIARSQPGFNNSVVREKDSDITWLYGPWKCIEPSPTAHAAASQTSPESSQLPSAIKPALKQKTPLSFASCTPLAPERPTNEPPVLEKYVLQTAAARALFKFSWPQYALSRLVASALRYTNERYRRILPQFPSTNRSKVHFDLEVQQCIAINPTITHDAAYNGDSSLLQNSRFDDASRVPGEYYFFMDSSLFCEKSQGQSITQLPCTELKSHPGSIEPRQGGGDNIYTEDGIFFL